jgi:hypothetical protein
MLVIPQEVVLQAVLPCFMPIFFFLFRYTNPQPHFTIVNRQQYIYMSLNTSLVLCMCP